jgi:hypothetical protein
MSGKVFFTTQKGKKGYNYKMHSRPALKILFFLLFTMVFIFMTGFLTPLISKDGLEVTRDKDKTVYSIGSSEKRNNEKTEEEKDKERAWEMLKNMNNIIDKRGQKGQKNGQQGGE